MRLVQDLPHHHVDRLQLKDDPIDKVFIILMLLEKVNLLKYRLMCHLNDLLPQLVGYLSHKHLRLLKRPFKS